MLTKKHRRFLENFNEPIIITMYGYDAICVDCNKKYKELLGYSKDKLINKNTHHLISNEEKTKVFQTHAILNEKSMHGIN